MNTKIRNNRQAGFSTLEMLIVVAITVIVMAIAIPGYISTTAYLRAAGDLRALNGITAQAKMRAAADFTRARAYADLSGNAYQLQVWNKSAGASGCWVADVDANKTNCITYAGSAPSGPGVLALSQGDTFGVGALTQGPPTPAQATITWAGQCLKDDGTTAINNSACIVFNSRGIPINPANSAPIATGALYLTNQTVVNGVTVNATGSIQTWSTPASSANWKGQ
jgi:Tfp pilus assembly protein FimT